MAWCFWRLAFLVCVWSRSLPDKNELANACLGLGHLSCDLSLWDTDLWDFVSRFCEIFLLVAGATLPTKLGMSFVIPVWGLKLLRERWRLGDAIKTSVWRGQTSNDWSSSTTWKETPKMTKWSKGLHLHSKSLLSKSIKIPQISTESISPCPMTWLLVFTLL